MPFIEKFEPISSAVKNVTEGIKSLSEPALVSSRMTKWYIQRERSVEKRFQKVVNHLLTHAINNEEKRSKRLSVITVTMSDALYSVKEGVFQSCGIVFKTTMQVILVAGRFEALFFHANLKDLTRWVFRKNFSYHDMWTNREKRIKNISISIFRIIFAPYQIFGILNGALVGMIFPDVGIRMRRQVYWIENMLNKKELANIPGLGISPSLDEEDFDGNETDVEDGTEVDENDLVGSNGFDAPLEMQNIIEVEILDPPNDNEYNSDPETDVDDSTVPTETFSNSSRDNSQTNLLKDGDKDLREISSALNALVDKSDKA